VTENSENARKYSFNPFVVPRFIGRDHLVQEEEEVVVVVKIVPAGEPTLTYWTDPPD